MALAKIRWLWLHTSIDFAGSFYDCDFDDFMAVNIYTLAEANSFYLNSCGCGCIKFYNCAFIILWLLLEHCIT